MSACQPVPRPFAQDPGKAANRLLSLPDAAGIAVRDVSGVPAPLSHDLAAAMSAALLDQNIPASTTSANRRSFVLRGRAGAHQGNTSRGESVIVWELRNASGKLVGSHTQRVSAVWTSAGSGARKTFAERTAEQIASLLRGPSAARTAPRGFLPPVYVAPVTGAPELGNRALRGAMRAALRAERIDVTGERTAGGLVVTGKVVMGPVMSGFRSITVDWTVSRTGGSRLGEMTQRNVIESSDRDEAWRPMAEDIADGAAQGMLDLLRRLRQRRGTDASKK